MLEKYSISVKDGKFGWDGREGAPKGVAAVSLSRQQPTTGCLLFFLGPYFYFWSLCIYFTFVFPQARLKQANPSSFPQATEVKSRVSNLLTQRQWSFIFFRAVTVESHVFSIAKHECFHAYGFPFLSFCTALHGKFYFNTRKHESAHSSGTVLVVSHNRRSHGPLQHSNFP